MIKENKLDKSFGSVASFAGIVIFITGLVFTYFSLAGLILILIGAFVGFTSTSTSINFDTKTLRYSLKLFGIFNTGKWISADSEMKIGIIKSNKIWRTYSRSNRPLDIPDNSYKIYLFDADNKPLIPIKKIDSPDSAKVELYTLGKQLGILLI